jgi:hypothetical protein
MAAQAASRNRGVDVLALRLVVMALETLGGIRVLVQRNGMHGGSGTGSGRRNQNQDRSTEDRWPEASAFSGESIPD